MNHRLEDAIEPGDLAAPASPTEVRSSLEAAARLAVGLLALAGAGLVFAFLLAPGWFVLTAGFLFEMLAMKEPRAIAGGVSLLMIAAMLIVLGLCLAFGLLVVAFRGITRSPFPGLWGSLRFVLITLTLVVATAVAVGLLTRVAGT
ncbi:hypothetical protein [Paludisphaera soli]|uniref:hypothetical protein n=1 Tax=Paludisphaera soli TaxID=2712865 RepID=UPI0013EC1406|nr:hypothetical protein [Paludisphaera soli]